MIHAFITNKKSPKVKMVAGKVNSTKIGFTNTFSKANTAATNKAVIKVFPSKVTPGKKWASTTTATAVKSNFINKFMWYFF